MFTWFALILAAILMLPAGAAASNYVFTYFGERLACTLQWLHEDYPCGTKIQATINLTDTAGGTII